MLRRVGTFALPGLNLVKTIFGCRLGSSLGGDFFFGGVLTFWTFCSTSLV